MSRAKTEEKHLMEDPAYRDYSLWIAEHGVLGVLKRRAMSFLNPLTLDQQRRQTDG